MSGGSSGGSGTGSSANVYEPAAQGTADYNWNQILQPLINQSANAGAGTPGGTYYPQAQGDLNAITNNPWMNTYLGGAVQASGQSGAINNQSLSDAGLLQNLAGIDAGPANAAIINNAFNPEYGALIQNAGLNTGAYTQAAEGSQLGANLGTGLIGAAQLLASGGASPVSSAGAGQAAAAGQQLMGAGGQILSSGFDPQQAMYNQQSSNALNQQNAINAMSGIAGTPYGAGVTGQNQQLFNQNWLNQQLGRQQSAASAAGAADTTGGALTQMPLTNYLSQVQAAAPLGSAGQTLTQAPVSTQNNQLSVLNQLLNSQNTAGSVGAGALANLTGATSAAGTGAANLGTSALNTLLAGTNAPYAASNAVGTNDLTALGNLINIGNSQYQLPQSVLGNLQSYMGLGQSASSTANQIDAAQNNQLASIGSGLGTAGALGLGAYNAGLFGSAAAPAAASLLIPGTDAAIAGGSAATPGIASALGLGALGS